VEELSLRTEFHRALDPLAPPAPWLAARVREGLRAKTYPSRPPRAWFTLTLPRMSTRLLAGVLIVALTVAAAGAFLAINNYVHRSVPVRTHPGATSRSCGQGGLFMVTKTVGWQGTTRSTDGGVTWRDVSPSNVPGWVKGGSSTCVLDADHAWVTQGVGSVPYQPDHLIVLSTRDGGQTWQQGEPIPVGALSWRTNFAVELDFVDDQRGWLLTDTGSVSTPPFLRTLYATSDGGLHWSRLISASQTDSGGLGQTAVGCAESGMTFISPDKGWLTWNCNSGPSPSQTAAPMAVTLDGGRTWATVSLHSYPTGSDWSCGANPPIFTRNQGVLQMTCGGIGHPSWTGIYRASDGGRTWALSPAPVFAQVDFIDGNTGYILQANVPCCNAGSDLYRTNDSGHSWTVVERGLFPGQDVVSYQFLEPNTGFAEISGSPAFWWTYDSGKTWSLPAPYRSIGNVVCPLPSDPGAGTAPVPVKMVSPTTGWAIGARRTTDGGSHWSNVGPRSVPDRSSGYGEFFLDGTHAWVAQAAGSSAACADQVVVLSTIDGGLTWQQASRLKIQLPKAADAMSGDWAPSLGFIDAEHGWLLVEPAVPFTVRMDLGEPMDVRRSAAALYWTSDGGHHWTLVSTQAGANSAGCKAVPPVSFSSTTTGWMQVQCVNNGSAPPVQLLVTHDGGATWAVQELAPSSCCVAPLPTFLDDQHGWLFVSGDPLLLATGDGGNTWIGRGLPPLSYYSCVGKEGPTTCSNEGIVAADFIDLSHGWAVVGKTNQTGSQFLLAVERTDDGGKTWTDLRADLPVDPSFPDPYLPPSQVSLTFVSATDGFWWSGSELFRTSDSGTTWTRVTMTSD
jgi:photosystem II stability/assembly factor-like uncharacterized protein